VAAELLRPLGNRFYENMRLVDAGDLVFSYFDQLIQYIGVVQSPAVS
jgi:hypothetical protein